MEDDIKLELGEKSPEFKRILKIASSLISETEITFTEDKIRIHDSDPAMVALVDLEISKEWFGTETSAYCYDAEEESTEVGVSLEKLEETLRGSTKDEQVQITYGETRTGQRTWESLVSANHEDEPDYKVSVNRTSSELQIEEVFPEKELEVNHPGNNLDFSNKLTVNADSLKTVVNEANRIADSIRMNVQKNTVGFSVEGDYSNIEAEIREEGIQVEEFTGEATSNLSLDYFKKMLGKRLDAISNELVLHQGNGEESVTGDFPIMLEASSENVKAEIVLAPRIEEEE